MKGIHLSNLSWSLTGYSPTSWQMGRVLEQAIPCVAEIAAELFIPYALMDPSG